MSKYLDNERLSRLIDAGRALVVQLDLEAVLDQLLATARELTSARYAALGILDEHRRELERFLTSGIDPETRRAIGELPRGRGILGVLIDEPRPLRLADVGEHPRSYGFPAGHPPMHSFLGVPILIRGEAWGNLYLTEKPGGFDAVDEQSAVVLADWAAIAIDNARLYEAGESRREDLEQAVRGLEATRAIAVAIGAETDLTRILELIVKRGRALVDARSVVILLREGEELVVAASAGQADQAPGLRIPIESSTSGEVVEEGRPEQVADVRAGLRIAPEHFGVTDARGALLVPLVYRGQALGVLAAFDHASESLTFSAEDEQALRSFAASAATAVAIAQTVQRERLRYSLEAAEAERRRWARELHDETLQALGALRVLLSSSQRRDDPQQTAQAVSLAVAQIEQEIENLRAIINELRPAALDELGLRPAIEALVARHRAVNGVEIACQLGLTGDDGAHRLVPELETTVYRFVQEALSNVVKHSQAQAVRLSLTLENGELAVEVADDGIGFDTEQPRSGLGLIGMHERIALAGGSVALHSGPGGTTIKASLAARYDESPAPSSTSSLAETQTLTSPRSNA